MAELVTSLRQDSGRQDAGKRDAGDRQRALDAAIGQIERAFGKGSVMKLGQRERAVEIDTVSTGSLGLDLALGVGGLPRGRIVEIYGPESSGKTTLTLHCIAEAQKAGGTCAFVDAEHALDPGYARKLGVNIDELLISQPDTGEQALEIADTLVRSLAIDLVVIDSVAALVPKAELEGEMGDSHMGLQARLMSQALRKLTASIHRSNCILIFTNQIRQKIGVMFGNPETTTGGNALKFYASVRLDIRRIGAIKDREEVTGNQTRVKVVKNKVAPPFRVVEFDIMYGEGISKTGELLDLGVRAGVVEKSGSWFSYDSQRIGQGRENAKSYLKEHPEVAAAIEAALRGQAGLGGGARRDRPARRGARGRPSTEARDGGRGRLQAVPLRHRAALPGDRDLHARGAGRGCAAARGGAGRRAARPRRDLPGRRAPWAGGRARGLAADPPGQPATGVEPFELCKVADVGDAPSDPLDVVRSVALIRGSSTVHEVGAAPLAIGGDHTVPLPILRAIAATPGRADPVRRHGDFDGSWAADQPRDLRAARHRGGPDRARAASRSACAARATARTTSITAGASGSRGHDRRLRGAGRARHRGDPGGGRQRPAYHFESTGSTRPRRRAPACPSPAACRCATARSCSR